MSNYPQITQRRLRMSATLRTMVQETVLQTSNLIYPLFVVEGKNIRKEISSMPGVYQLSVDEIVKECHEVNALGIPAVILFGIPKHKDLLGSEAYQADGIIPTAIQAIKKALPSLVVITDVCLCEYTSHGHCGVIEGETILNEKSVELLVKSALVHAKAGADMVAPSDMFDGRVGAIREELNKHQFAHIPIMSYAAKYASGFYGPFREAADCAPHFGDRKSHQMDPANSNEALREVEQDIAEGADIVMVKPALAYLDIIRRVKDTFAMPTAAYNVSGEYAMIKAAAKNGWIDEEKVMLETLLSMKRAGADLILTYFAKDAAKLLNK